MSKSINKYEKIIEKAETRPFWMSERIIFCISLLSFIFFALILTVTEHLNVSERFTNFTDLLFDSISIGTLTGLFRGDSGLISFWGQLTLVGDMVVNGLITGVISILLIVFIRFGFDHKDALKQELHKIHIHSGSILIFIFIDFLIIWSVGTVLLLLSGSASLWEAIFNAISHLLNDGITALPGNMVRYSQNIPMLLSGAFLITLGGLGISIRALFYKYILRTLGFSSWAVKIPESILAPRNFVIAAILVTVSLQLLGALLFINIESDNTRLFAENATAFNKGINLFYLSVSSRTAGFSTFSDLSILHDKSLFVLMALMTIGGTAGSFTGGILKTTAFIYLLVYIISSLRGDKHIRTNHSFIHFSERTTIEANFRIIGFGFITSLLIMVLLVTETGSSGLALIFEGISAVSNTGLTIGATTLLSSSGMLLIALLMIIGKMGFITMVISFFPKLELLIEHAKHYHDEFPVD